MWRLPVPGVQFEMMECGRTTTVTSDPLIFNLSQARSYGQLLSPSSRKYRHRLAEANLCDFHHWFFAPFSAGGGRPQPRLRTANNDKPRPAAVIKWSLLQAPDDQRHKKGGCPLTFLALCRYLPFFPGIC
jgi:hypothetical protein